MPPLDMPSMTPQDEGVNAADSTNANNLNKQLSAVIQALGDNSDAVLTSLAAIAAAITASIIGGTTGATPNAILVSKGSGGFALQPTLALVDPATGAGQFFDALTLDGIAVATLNTNPFLQQQGFARSNLTDAATIAWNLQTKQSAYVLLTAGIGATRVLGAPTNMLSGYRYMLVVQQSSTGANALTYDAVFKWTGGVAPTLSVGNNAIDILEFTSDGTNMYGINTQLNYS